MTRTTHIHADARSWLTETADPGVRYLALRDLIGLDSDDHELRDACTKAHRSGPIATVLDAMDDVLDLPR